jgi:protein-S-isoprenylcysteine O-methyltransferase Ste14
MSMATHALSRGFADKRILWSRLILVATVFVAVFSSPPGYLAPWAFDVLELFGFTMLAAAMMWRVWCLVFIGGTKDGSLSMVGPYSVMRNPLYAGSFLGVVGFGLAVGLPALALSLAVAFGLLYPAVVAQEEVRLRDLFGEPFERYCQVVPRWVPRWSLYKEPASIVVDPARIRQGILDGMWYLWAFAFTEFLEVMHEHALIPYLF